MYVCSQLGNPRRLHHHTPSASGQSEALHREHRGSGPGGQGAGPGNTQSFFSFWWLWTSVVLFGFFLEFVWGCYGGVVEVTSYFVTFASFSCWLMPVNLQSWKIPVKKKKRSLAFKINLCFSYRGYILKEWIRLPFNSWVRIWIELTMPIQMLNRCNKTND